MRVDPEYRREPTIFNAGFIQIIVAVFFGLALYYRQADLAVLMILILVVMGGARVWNRMGPVGVRCHMASHTRRVFPGDTVSLNATVENNKWVPVWLRIRWSFGGLLKTKVESGSILGQQAFALWQQTIRFQQDVVAMRRGVYNVGASRLYTSDLFGFYEKPLAATKATTTIVVYPRLVPLRPLGIPRRDLFGIPGGRSPVEDPIYILGTRDYQPSRPARHIHWKASARHRRLQEKLFEPSEQARVLLSLDVGSFQDPDRDIDFEHTLEVLASLAVGLDRQGAAVGFVANGSLKGGGTAMISPVRSPRQIPVILETLARLRRLPKGDAARTVRQALGVLPGLSGVHCCFTDDDSALKMEALFRQRQIPMVLLTCHPCPDRPGSVKDRYAIDEIRIDKAHAA